MWLQDNACITPFFQMPEVVKGKSLVNVEKNLIQVKTTQKRIKSRRVHMILDRIKLPSNEDMTIVYIILVSTE